MLAAATPEQFALPTVCTDWSVRDVLAHCSAVLTHLAAGRVPGFSPADNQVDVDVRASWEMAAVLDELWNGYEGGAAAIDAAGGALDGVGIGEWMHGGDVRDAMGVAAAYASAGVDLAVPLLLERSRRQGKPAIDVIIDGVPYRFGSGDPIGRLTTDVATFVRLTGGRRPDPERYRLSGVDAAELVLFS